MNLIPTRRFYFSLLAVLVFVLVLQLVLPAVQTAVIYQIFLVLDLLVVILVGLDIIQTPNKKVLSAQRDMNSRFSIGRENIVAITLKNLSDKHLVCRLTDDYPQEMNCSNCDFSFAILAGETTTLSYVLIPKSKGVYNFGAVYIRFKSHFGFFDRQIKNADSAFGTDQSSPRKSFIKDVCRGSKRI